VGRSTQPELGTHNADVKRLRALLRGRATRHAEQRFVAEGPRVVEAALALAPSLVEALYVGADAAPHVRAIAERANAGVNVRMLGAGVAPRVSDTQHAQGLFAVVAMPQHTIDRLARARLVLACELVSDPGNAGTLMRSAAAAGADGIVLGAGSVDAYNPKVVRASAGACFTIPIVEDTPIVQALEWFAGDWQRIGAVATGGAPPESFDLRARTAFVLGHEVRGLTSGLPLDGAVTIPMRAGQSLNVAMAGTALLFEAARQHRARA
jgi:RNA methyltransferase, TrmH family